jgi:hypothetical protein
MKPIQLLAIAALALLVGCTKTETLSSSGVEDDKPDVDVTVQGTTGGEPTGATDGGLDIASTTGTTDATKPADEGAAKPGDAPKQDPPGSAGTGGLVEGSLAGTYDGTIEIPAETIEKIKQMAAQQGGTSANVDQLLSQLTKEKLSLDLKSDGTFVMTAASQTSANGGNKGTWKLTAPDTVTVTPDKLSAELRNQMKQSGMTDAQIDQNEKAMRAPQTLKVADGGKTLKLTQSNMGMTMFLTFKRK